MLGSFAASLRALVDPMEGVGLAVAARRWGAALFLVCACTALSQAAVAIRLDTGREVIPQIAAAGELTKVSEREIAEKVEQAQRVAMVGGVAKGLFLVPLLVLLLAVALKIALWLVGKKGTFAACFTTAAIAWLPMAVFHAVVGASALNQPSVAPAKKGELVVTSLDALLGLQGLSARVGKAFDFFNLWTVLLLGLGLAAAAGLTRLKGVALACAVYLLFSAVAFVAAPGL